MTEEEEEEEKEQDQNGTFSRDGTLRRYHIRGEGTEARRFERGV